MVGDWVIFHESSKVSRKCIVRNIDKDSNLIVEWIDDDDIYSELTHDISPVPLTPEILEKNGFKDILHPRFNERTLCKVWDDYSIHINVDNKIVHMVISPLAAIRNGRADYIFPNPDYVHEFQHILKLLGITKSIQV